MPNQTYVGATEAAENMIQELFATDEPLLRSEIEVRRLLARAVLDAWFEHAKSLASGETHNAELDRFGECLDELPLSARVLQKERKAIRLRPNTDIWRAHYRY